VPLVAPRNDENYTFGILLSGFGAAMRRSKLQDFDGDSALPHLA
jgi:hypothetical protein